MVGKVTKLNVTGMNLRGHERGRKRLIRNGLKIFRLGPITKHMFIIIYFVIKIHGK